MSTSGEGARGVGTSSGCRTCGCGMWGMGGDETTCWGGIWCDEIGTSGGLSGTLPVMACGELWFFLGGTGI